MLLLYFYITLIDLVLSGFTKIGNNGNLNSIQINNIGSDIFNISKLNNWHYDIRFPLITPQTTGKYQNIYSPNIVNNGDTNFNVYFGGWDGVQSPHDSVSITVTPNTFNTFNPHYSQIESGTFNELNNCNAIKINNTFWYMVYTTLPYNSQINKPGYSTCTDGINWIPNSGDTEYLLNMYHNRQLQICPARASLGPSSVRQLFPRVPPQHSTELPEYKKVLFR